MGKAGTFITSLIEIRWRTIPIQTLLEYNHGPYSGNPNTAAWYEITVKISIAKYIF